MINFYDRTNLYNPLEGKKKEVVNYIVDFFGEKYRNKIENNLSDIDIIFSIRSSHRGDDYQDIHKNNLIELTENCLNEWINKAKVLDRRQFAIDANQLEKLRLWKDDLNIHGKYSKEIYNFMWSIYDYEPLLLQVMLNNKNFVQNLKKELNTLDDIYRNKYKVQFDDINQKFYRLSVLPFKEEVETLENNFKNKWLNIFEEKICKNLFIEKSKKNESAIKEIASLFYDYKNLYPNFFEYLVKEQLVSINIEDVELKAKNLNSERLMLNFDFDKERRLLDEEIYDLKNGVAMTLKGLNEFDPKNMDFNLNYLKKDLRLGNSGVIHSLYCDETKKFFHYIRVDSPIELKEEDLIHELLHGAQFDCVDEKAFKRTGIHYVSFNDYKTFGDRNLNEVINEYFTCKIMDKIIKDDFIINRNFEELNLTKSHSLYSNAFPFVEDFLKTNLQDLKECCMSSNHKLIYEYYGEDNVRALNQLIEEIFVGYIYDEFYDVEGTVRYFGDNKIKDKKWIDIANDETIDWDYDYINPNVDKFLDLVKRVDKTLKAMTKSKIEYDKQFQIAEELEEEACLE